MSEVADRYEYILIHAHIHSYFFHKHYNTIYLYFCCSLLILVFFIDSILRIHT